MGHTPVPWEVVGRSIYQIDAIGGREVIHGSGIKGRDGEERSREDVSAEIEDNAHFIVQACNSYDESIKVLRYVKETIHAFGNNDFALALHKIDKAISNSETGVR